MLSINQSVISRKFGKGVITRIITKSTGYVEVKFESGVIRKEMAFNLTDENGNSLKKAPNQAAPKALSPIQDATAKMLWINNCTPGDRNGLSYTVCEKMISSIEIAAQTADNDFILSLCDSVLKYMKCSDKQAFCLAKFAIENNVEL